MSKIYLVSIVGNMLYIYIYNLIKFFYNIYFLVIDIYVLIVLNKKNKNFTKPRFISFYCGKLIMLHMPIV
jgi:hypothetical protein